MPSTRRNALSALVSILAAVTPGNGFINNLTGAGTVSVATESWEKRRDSGRNLLVRVRDGAETVRRGALTGGTMDGALALTVELLVRSQGDAKLVDTANDLIADVRLAVDRSPRLNSTVADAYVATVGEPEYDFDGRIAAVTLVVAATYDYAQGAGI